jgi:NAD+ kinase
MTLPITRAALIARLKLPAALDALMEAAGWLDAHGCVPVIEQQSAEAAGLSARWPSAPRGSLAQQADVVIAFGGDGTLLDAATVVVHSGHDAPLIGVNLGRLGFLTEVARAEMIESLERLVTGRFTVETRLMLEGAIARGAATPVHRLALNDIVVTRSALSRMTEMDVYADAQLVCHIKADGVIIATATGSTAYNLSAGGPIVHPSVDALVLTPIAPHTLTQRPLVLPATTAIELRPSIDPQSEVIVTFDGQFGVPLMPGDIVAVHRAPRELRLLHTASRSHFAMLREKLKWGNG